MGNKILGKRSRNFYKGFNQRQITYLQQKFQSLSQNGVIKKQLFIQAYQLSQEIFNAFMLQADYQQTGSIDQYEFVCLVSHLCNLTIDQLGCKLFGMLASGKKGLKQEGLLPFTSMCMKYNKYIQKGTLTQQQIKKANQNKFRKYDFDKSKSIQMEEFCKICRKDLDYKTWLFNMGLITKNQMEYQDQIYDLVDSDVGEEVQRHLTTTDPNVDRVKRGAQHRQNEDQFHLQEVVGDQSAPIPKPWIKESSQITQKDLGKQLFEGTPLNQLSLQYVLGYRSHDCRNNLKFDSKDQIVYHQAALGIVMREKVNRKADEPQYDQKFLSVHKDDISCLDIVDDLVATGQVGTRPLIVLWETNQNESSLKSSFLISKQLQQSVANVCISSSKKLLAATCNNQDHKLVVYNLNELRQIQKDLTSPKTGIVCCGALTKSLVFDIKFTSDQSSIVAVTVKEILFVTFQNNVVNSSRGQFGNFSASMALCLLPLKTKTNQYMLTGMGNGSIYFWQKDKCMKAVVGHSGSVSAICYRNDSKSFISGDKSGKIIIWDQSFKKQRTLNVPKTNCPSSMIVSLAHSSKRGQLLIGTKGSNIYLLKQKDTMEKAKTIMNGHHDGMLWAMALHKTQPFLYTGGQDQRIIKWNYKSKKYISQVLCPYQIRSLDYNANNKLLLVGFINGIVQCYDPQTLAKIDKLIYNKIKNPDRQALNLAKFDYYGQNIIVCYSYPKPRIAIMGVTAQTIRPPVFIDFGQKFTQKIISIDVSKANKTKNEPKYLRCNTQGCHYFVYDISKQKPVKLQPKDKSYIKMDWDSHTVMYSPQTQGIYNLQNLGVKQQDISCCAYGNLYKNCFVVGDKYSKLKLFNYPALKGNSLFNKYQGHSNTVTAIQFNQDETYMVSIGGQQKSILIWKYDTSKFALKYPQFHKQMQQINQQQVKKKRVIDQDDQFGQQKIISQQAGSTNQYKGQIKTPTNFISNPRKDNNPPKQSIKIHHVFGVRNKYLNDQVRNQCRFSTDKQHALFPTACMAVKMDIEERTQQVFLQHKEDIVSFAVDRERKIMATGQMAQKNLKNPLKKILSIYVWDIKNKKVLSKLDGFHTIAIILLQFSPSGKLLFTCGDDDKHTFAVYDWRSGSVLYSGPVSRGRVTGVAWKSQTQFVTCGLDHVKIWQKNKGQMCRFDAQTKTQGQICVTNSNNTFITGGAQGNLFNWTGNQATKPIKAHTGKVQCLVQKKFQIYSGGADGNIYRWKKQANGAITQAKTLFINIVSAYGKTKELFSPQQSGVLSLDFSGDGDQCLIATKGCSIVHYKAQRYRIITQGHYKGELWGLACSKSSDFFVTGGDDNSVRLWDIKQRKQILRTNFKGKIRGVDWSNQKKSIAIADNDARIFLYSETLQKYDEYTGKPFTQNSKQGKGADGWVQQIKFSPNGQHIAYGTHGRSRFMQFLNVSKNKLSLRKGCQAGTSAMLHIDWDREGNMISLNTQANQLLFITKDGASGTATGLRDQKWTTWTQKFGFPVQGIFQGADYSDVNTVCRSNTGSFLAVGYDDQLIRLFNYPCYIPKQSFTAYAGHSSHVTKIRFTPNYMVSLGGQDKTIIVWEVEGQTKAKLKAVQAGYQSDGLDDLDQDVDIPSRIMQKRKKKAKQEEFYQAADQGDEFMAVKPWLGAIKEPTYAYPSQNSNAPPAKMKLQYVHGYRTKDCRQNLYFVDQNILLYHAAGVLIYHFIDQKPHQQQLFTDHDDDILSIDYHKQTGGVLTGQLGPKPLVNYYRNKKLVHSFRAPVIKGVLAVAISPQGNYGVCAGMDDQHWIALLDLEKGKIIQKQKGGRKVILKMGWINNSSFVGIGINNFKIWNISNGRLKVEEGKGKGNFVSLAIGSKMVLTGQSAGKIKLWRGTDPKQIKQLTNPVIVDNQQVQQPTSVVQSLSIQQSFIAAGTKDGYIFLLDHNFFTISKFALNQKLPQYKLISQNPSIRSIDFKGNNKMLLGTFGSQIYQVNLHNVGQAKKNTDKNSKIPQTGIRSINCHVKCHYSPNNSWTNQVWGLDVSRDEVFTCSDDATLRCWSINDRKLLSCASLNKVQNPDKKKVKEIPFIQVSMDKKTKDYVDSSKGRSVCVSPDRQFIVVGCKDGRVKIFNYNQKTHQMSLKVTFKHAKQWISDIKFGYNLLIIGSHDNAVYVYDYDPDNGEFKTKYKPMNKHSSYITHIDVSRDSCYLQSTCGAYQLLFWDLNTGKQITSGATLLRDQHWMTWTCNLGWPVQGIYPKCTDGTFIHSVHRSNTSLMGTRMKQDTKTPYLLAAGNNNGKVCLYSYPSTIKNSKFVQGKGHSSHITNVRWNEDDSRVLSVGGEDQCLMYWTVSKK